MHLLPSSESGTVVRFGLVADPHVADLPPALGRHYREAAARLERRAAEFTRDGAAFLVELGDLKDAGPDRAATLANLDGACRALRAFGGPVVPVLGNHDVDRISKRDFLDGFAKGLGLAVPPEPFGAFDEGGVRFIFLDGDFSPDGRELSEGDRNHRDCTVPPDQVAWLRGALAEAGSRPCVVFCHSPLTGDWDSVITNGAEIRAALEAAGNVSAVFQAHTHDAALRMIAGIPYVTVPAICRGEGPEAGAAMLATVWPDGRIGIEGRGGAPSFLLPGGGRLLADG